MHKKLFLPFLGLFVESVAVFVIFLSSISNPLHEVKTNPMAYSLDSISDSPQVLGSYYQAPRIFVSDNRQGYSAGGVISQSAFEEPSLELFTYGNSGTANLDIYEANIAGVLDYLTYTGDKQQSRKVDLSKYQLKGSISASVGQYQGNRATLPITGEGIWLIHVKFGDISTYAYLIRSKLGTVAKSADGEILFWTQNLETRRSADIGSISVYHLDQSPQVLSTNPIGTDGITRLPLSAQADVAIVTSGNQTALVPLNLQYLNFGSSFNQFAPPKTKSKYFIFADRPLYRPGDTVYFKAITRNDSDTIYELPSGSAEILVFKDWDEKNVIFQKSYRFDPEGTISDQFTLPSVGTGYYQIKISQGTETETAWGWGGDWNSDRAGFQVEHFRKPEYFIDLKTTKTSFVSKDKIDFTLTGNYFSGHPIANQSVTYAVYTANYYEYDYYNDHQWLNDDYRYGFWGGKKVSEGKLLFDSQGHATTSIDTGTESNVSTSPQVFSIEASFDDGSGNPAFARKNVLVYPGEFSIYRSPSSTYSGSVGDRYTLPIQIKRHDGKSVDRISINSTIHWETWVQEALKEGQKYPNYKKVEEDLSPIQTFSDTDGSANLSFTPTKPGSYTFTVNIQDTKGNTISKQFYVWIRAENEPLYTGSVNSDLSIEPDKKEYQPGETAKLKIWSNIENRDVLLTLERGRVNRWQVIKLNGKSTTHEEKTEPTDIPNIYAQITSFSDSGYDFTSVNLPISPKDKKIQVKISPDLPKYGPGQTVNLNITTTDTGGKPVSADTAVWAVDKAIFELSTNTLGDIFDRFWSQRSQSTITAHSFQNIEVQTAEMGGCFQAGTQILMADKSTKNIEDIKPGDYISTFKSATDHTLAKARVKTTTKKQDIGTVIINGKTKVTPDHILWINNSWQTAGSIQIGDYLLGSSGEAVTVSSVEFQSEISTVYNLEVEDYHTYIADGVWVHNQKGDGSARSIFKDTAYWNPSVRTDENGQAKVSFKLPDNLTTWSVAAVSASRDTQVGQSNIDLLVSKDVISRLLLPNLLRVGDKATISALVHNFTDSDETFAVSLGFDSGKSDPKSNYNSVNIPAGGTQQFYWSVSPETQSDTSHFTLSAKSQNGKSDFVNYTLPIRPFGFSEDQVRIASEPTSFEINVPEDVDLSNSMFTLSLGSNLLGTLPSSMRYLIDYPYGCVEQTTSRFVPALIAKANTDIYGDSLGDKNLDDIIQKGIERLSVLQQPDGGWGWWSGGSSSPFITSYVLEYLSKVPKSGFVMPPDMIPNAVNFLRRLPDTDRETLIFKTYGLAVSGQSDKPQQLTNLDGLDPDILAIAVMANILNGHTNSTQNGLNRLVDKAQINGFSASWSAGPYQRFGSVDTSTALAIRALVLEGSNRDLAVKGARFMESRRKNQYWGNSFATSQTIRAITDLYRSGDEDHPNYRYEVSLNGSLIGSGTANNSKKTLKDINISGLSLKKGKNTIQVSKNGNGQIYTSLQGHLWRTDKNLPSKSEGLKIEKEFVSDRGSDQSLAVGDTITVNLTYSGLLESNNYLIIEDHLPAGLIPINWKFNNEQSTENQSSGSYYWGPVREFTENGVNLSVYEALPGTHTISYKARVLAEGSFTTPPTKAQLMYRPEIYAQTGTTDIRTTSSPQTQTAKLISKSFLPILNHPVFLAIVGIAVLIPVTLLLVKKFKKPHVPPSA